MSRAGRIHLIRMMRAQRSRDILAALARELLPSCREAANFFFESAVEFITAPVAESAASFIQETERRGAVSLEAAVPQLADKLERVREELITAASQANIDLPAKLVQKPAFVTTEVLEAEQDALQRVKHVQAAPEEDVSFEDLEQRLLSEQERVEQAFEAACLVAGRHIEERTHPVFASVRDLLTLPNSPEREEVLVQVQEWADEVSTEMQAETEKAWAGVALAACKLALDGVSDMAVGDPNLENWHIQAKDKRHPSRGIDIKVDVNSGEIGYEVFGYRGNECAPVEKDFLDELSAVLGVEIGVTNLKHWSTIDQEPGKTSSLEKEVSKLSEQRHREQTIG